MRRFFVFSLLCLTMRVIGYAQLSPAPSSTQSLTQDFGLGKILLTYSRPNVKGRKIFGSTEPYGSVWRTGANAATTLKFTEEVSLEGHKVAPGEYALFTIPGVKEWTIILNKTSKQWGAYNYKSEDDYLRFTVSPNTLKENVETFTIQFDKVYPGSCEMDLMWEHTGVTLHLTTDFDSKVMARIDSAMKTDKKPYYEAVNYYWNNKKDMSKALPWAIELEKVKGMPPMVAKLWKARVLLRLGNKKDAISSAEEGIKAAETAKSDEYKRLNQEVITEAKK